MRICVCVVVLHLCAVASNNTIAMLLMGARMHTYLKIIGNIFKKFENKKKLYYVRIIPCSWEPLYVGCGRAVWCMCLWMFDHLSAYSRFCISISDTIQVHFSGRIIKPTRAIHPQYAADLNLGFVVFFFLLSIGTLCSPLMLSFYRVFQCPLSFSLIHIHNSIFLRLWIQ